MHRFKNIKLAEKWWKETVKHKQNSGKKRLNTSKITANDPYKHSTESPDILQTCKFKYLPAFSFNLDKLVCLCVFLSR